jgi:hypothetical protein
MLRATRELLLPTGLSLRCNFPMFIISDCAYTNTCISDMLAVALLLLLLLRYVGLARTIQSSGQDGTMYTLIHSHTVHCTLYTLHCQDGSMCTLIRSYTLHSTLYTLHCQRSGWFHVPPVREYTWVALLLQAVRGADDGWDRPALRTEHGQVTLPVQWYDELFLPCCGTVVDQDPPTKLVVLNVTRAAAQSPGCVVLCPTKQCLVAP